MSTIRTNTILDSSGGNTATINSIPLRPGVIDPDNRVINGAFDIWQRGTSFSTSGYSADRWVQSFFGGTATTSRQSFALGDTLGQSNPKYFLRQSVSGQSLSNHFSSIQQRIEDVTTYAGQTVTVLGWVRRSSGTGDLYVQLSQQFGSGGSPSTAVYNAFQTVALSGSWQPFAYTTTLPSVAGKTLGTNNNDYLQLDFYSSIGTAYGGIGTQTINIDLWGIHIKVGTHGTDAIGLYKEPELGPELLRCQRYFETGSVGLTTYGSSGQTISALLPFQVTKRATPTITYSGTAYTNASNLTTISVAPNSVRPGATTTSLGTTAYFSNFTADSEI